LSATPLYLLALFASSCALCARPSRPDTARWPLPSVIQVLSAPCVQLFAFSKAHSFTPLRLRCLTARLGARLYMHYQLPFHPALPGLAWPSGRRQGFGLVPALPCIRVTHKKLKKIQDLHGADQRRDFPAAIKRFRLLASPIPETSVIASLRKASPTLSRLVPVDQTYTSALKTHILLLTGAYGMDLRVPYPLHLTQVETGKSEQHTSMYCKQ
jgi:hypothetical protein